MQVKILDVSVENIVKGKSRYSKASVAYSIGGEAKTQNIMSFVNPDVFKKVQEMVGQTVEVSLTKNSAGYNEWAAITNIDDIKERDPREVTTGAVVGLAAAATRVTGSNYETPAERAQKQVYIVKQSSISNAIEYLQAVHVDGEPAWNVNNVLEVAQEFVDYVFDTPKPE